MAIHCAYGQCDSDSRYKHLDYMKDVDFIPFPTPYENVIKCQRWVIACGQAGLSYSHVTKDTYICTKHFVGGKGPTKEHPDPIPLFQAGDHAYTNKVRNDPFLSHKSCSVPQCFGRPSSQVSIHKFPSNPKYREKWIEAFRMKRIPKNLFACSLHFKEDDYFQSPRRRRLKLNAIPTRNLPHPSYEENEFQPRKSRFRIAKQKLKRITRLLCKYNILQTRTDEVSKRKKEEIIKKLKRAPLSTITPAFLQFFISGARPSESPSNERRKELSLQVRNECLRKKKQQRKYHRSEKGNEVTINSEKVYNEEEGLVSNIICVLQFDWLTTNNDSPNTVITEVKEEPTEDSEESPEKQVVLFKNKRIHVADFIDWQKKLQQKECAVCFKKVLSKEVCTYCPDCEEKPPLCLRSCFRIYHGY